MVYISSAIFSHRALTLISKRLLAVESRIATLGSGFERDLVLYLLFYSCVVCEGPDLGPCGCPTPTSTSAKLYTSRRCFFIFCLV